MGRSSVEAESGPEVDLNSYPKRPSNQFGISQLPINAIDRNECSGAVDR
jgi:hypothetical protein